MTLEPRGDPLTLRATPHRVRVAGAAAGLTDEAIRRGEAIAVATPSAAEWRRSISATLAFLGSCLLVAGVVCFVAFNWDRLGRFGKLGLVAIAIVLATVIAWKKLPRLSGQVALFSAAALVGPLLAIYGQTYQTGADPYGLFVTWSLLILPWAIAGRFGATWLLMLLLFDLAIILFFAQVVVPRETRDALWVPVLIASLHVASIVAWEWQLSRTPPLVPEEWVARVIVAAGFGALLLPAIAFVFKGRSGLPGVLGAFGLVGAVAATIRYYSHARRDRFMLTVAGVAAMTFVTVAVSRVVFDVLDLEELGMFVMAAFVIWQITFGVKLFRRTRAS